MSKKNKTLKTRKTQNNKTPNNKTPNNKTQNNKTKKRFFKKKDYNAGDGMLTSVWGPALWHYLHTMSFNYPVNPTKEDKINYRNFILNLQFVLPCKYCRINLKNNFKTMPLKMSDMNNRESFSRYIYELHELVNKLLNKKSNISYCDVRERYEHFRARCTDPKPVIFKPKNIKRNKTEKGCTKSMYGKKSRCIINIVPQENKGKTLKIDKKCVQK